MVNVKTVVPRCRTEKWINLGPENGIGSKQNRSAKMKRIAENLGMAFWTANGGPATKGHPNWILDYSLPPSRGLAGFLLSINSCFTIFILSMITWLTSFKIRNSFLIRKPGSAECVERLNETPPPTPTTTPTLNQHQANIKPTPNEDQTNTKTENNKTLQT